MFVANKTTLNWEISVDSPLISSATYITQTASGALSAEQALSTLSTGLMQVTTTTGVVSSITTSAGVAAVIGDATGTGALVFATSPTLVTPALGTPSALVGTNITGTASGLTAGTVTTNANMTGPVTSVGNATSFAADPVFSGSNTIESATSGGGYKRTLSEATATLTGATTTIQTNIPAGSRILGCQLRVDTLITSGDGGTSWTATYTGGAAQAIGAAGQAFTKDTKVNAMFNDTTETDIIASETDVLIDCDGAYTFSAGVVRAIVFYEVFVALDAAP